MTSARGRTVGIHEGRARHIHDTEVRNVPTSERKTDF